MWAKMRDWAIGAVIGPVVVAGFAWSVEQVSSGSLVRWMGGITVQDMVGNESALGKEIDARIRASLGRQSSLKECRVCYRDEGHSWRIGEAEFSEASPSYSCSDWVGHAASEASWTEPISFTQPPVAQDLSVSVDYEWELGLECRR